MFMLVIGACFIGVEIMKDAWAKEQKRREDEERESIERLKKLLEDT